VIEWGKQDTTLSRAVLGETRQCLDAYRAKPNLVEQDAGIEISNVEGGYGRKQLHELLQNGTDAMVGAPGQVSIFLTKSALYCANEGAPLATSGISALMASHLSTKRDSQIGRFGLGFKSVLGLSDSPEIISRSGSVRFDRSSARRRILEVVPDATRTPVLRIAEPFDPVDTASTDPVLRDLMTWASTVVRLPLKSGVDWLSEELRRFPAEFLLFTDHVERLELQDMVAGKSRGWTAERTGSRVELKSAAGVEGWHVFRQLHRPSAAARADAGEIAGRSEVEVAWAVPDRGRAAAGQFWAFFPTASRTTLSGIVNASFKTTEDRHDILDGPYNRELIESTLPRLVAENFFRLVRAEDPGSVFELLPARGREIRSWADDALNEPVVRAVAATRCIPDTTGSPGRVKDVRLSPRMLAERKRWATAWAGPADAPTDWIHLSVDHSTERRAKATRLYELSDVNEATPVQWLEALARTSTRGSIVAVQLAEQINRAEADQVVALRQARIVLSAAGSLIPPVPGKLFLPDPGEEPAGPGFVHPDLAADPETLDALQSLGIRPLDALGKLMAQISRMVGEEVRGAEVESLWSLTRQLPSDEAARALEAGFGRGDSPVRTVSGEVATVAHSLFPGTVVPADGSRDAEFAIDVRFHAQDHSTLEALGAVSGPRVVTRPPEEPWFGLWKDYALSAHAAAARKGGARIAAASVAIQPGRTAAHLDLLPRLSEKGRIAMTREALQLGTEGWAVVAHSRGAVDQVRVTNPAVWWIRKHGLLETALGFCPVATAVGPVEGVATDLLPVPVGLAFPTLLALGVRTTVDTAWWDGFLPLAKETLDVSRLHRLYAAAARAGAGRPSVLKIENSHGSDEVRPDEAVVTSDESAYALLKDVADVVLVDNDTDAEALRGRWGLGDARDLLTRRVLHAPSGDPVPAVDRFPGLRTTAQGLQQTVSLQPCSELAVEVEVAAGADTSVTDRTHLLEAETIYFRDNLGSAEVLAAVNTDLRLGLGERELQQTLDIGRRQETSNVARTVRAAGTVEEKLIALVGEAEVRRIVPARAIEAAQARRGRRLSATEIAGMATASAGNQILRKLEPAIESRGLAVPSRLNGGASAAAFTEELGLPTEFAGSSGGTRAAVESVSGPVRMPPLHSYQAECVARLRALLRPDGLSRGLIALPTGSGKTRVAVEALIDHVREEDPRALILWIAQTDELCEQAVETWSYVWRAVGAHETPLTVNRLWGSNDGSRAADRAQVVIAIDDKLTSLMGGGRHDWLTEASVVVVDEAHTSVSKTYTALFNWLGRGTRERDRPLVGLSATPYRGTNEDQTRQLVNRYDGNLITEGIFGDEDPHTHLQGLGILARVRHQVLEGMTLTPMALDASDSEGTGLIESRVDMQSVADDVDRNNRIIDSLLALDKEVTALVFAASVSHAQTLAAVLDNEGVRSAAVSAYTTPGERRERVRQFRSGKIRVLTNYNVLSQGFDAPKVGAVYVARPTFSPNRYQQMIGRGLRGPRNGGSEEVLIVNVQDNIDAFGEQLAFHHFDALWRETR